MPATASRPAHPKAPGTAGGIDEPLVRRVVDTFYGQVCHDNLLGPVFEAAVADWPEHFDKLADFWSSLTLMTGRYKGSPFEAHLPLPRLGDEHLATWLRLFDQTLRELCTPAQAEAFRLLAGRVAESLNLGLAICRGEVPLSPRGQTVPGCSPDR